MIDIGIIREDPKAMKKIADDKKVAVDIDRLLELDEERRKLQGVLDAKRQEKNEIAAKAGGGKPDVSVIEEGLRVKKEIQEAEAELAPVQSEFISILEKVPNIPTEDTPRGKTEDDNEILRTVGEKPSFDFDPKEHWELGKSLDVIDNERAAKVSGSRFTYLKGELAFVQFALVQFAFHVTTDEGLLKEIIDGAGLDVPTTPFIPVIPPVLVKRDTMKRMARIDPEDERYHIEKDDMFLVGSSEHSIGSMHMDESLDAPIRYIGYSSAFRREAGSHGKDVKGILRLHQFDKVEMESFSAGSNGLGEHMLFVAIQEYIMQALGLPYQVVLKCTADMGTPNARAVDIETWMPGQDTYRETHTADYMTDYQSRRLRTKLQGEYAHMNDATVVAVGRTIIAIMENYQEADGSIRMPEVLHSYLPFTEIKAKT